MSLTSSDAADIATASYGTFAARDNIKQKSPVNTGLKTGDERIELPLRVLETPVMPFDQSPTNLSYLYVIPYFMGSVNYILWKNSFNCDYSIKNSTFIYKQLPLVYDQFRLKFQVI